MENSALALSTDMVVVLGLVGFTMAMFMLERIRADATALVVLVALGLFGIVPASRLFDGFSGNAVISLMATMVLGAGLDRTGVLNRVAVNLLRWSKGMESRLLLLGSGFAALLSAFMQNPAVTALMLPVASRLAGRTGIALSRMLLPIAAAVIMGGTLTMVGNSPLILLNDLLASANRNLPPGVAALDPLPMFAPLPIGLLLVATALAYWHFGAKRWLPDDALKGVAPARTDSYFAQTYGIAGELYELTLTADSPLVGMSVGDAEQQRDAPLFLALVTGNETRLAPPADERLWVGSVIGVMGDKQAINDYAQKNLLRVSNRLRHFADLFNPSRAGISEAVIPPTSTFVGRRPEELRLRKRAGISLLAINRENQVWREDIRRIPLRAGDLLVLLDSPDVRSRVRGRREGLVRARKTAARDLREDDRVDPVGAGVRHRLPQGRAAAAQAVVGGGHLHHHDAVRLQHPGARAARADGGRRRAAGDRRARHGRGLPGHQLEDRLPDGLPDPTGLGDGFDRRGELDRTAHFGAPRRRHAGVGLGTRARPA